MKRFFCQTTNDNEILRGDEHSHLAYVLRAKAGEKVVLCPQDGYDYIYEITEIGKKETLLKKVDRLLNENEPRVHVTLFMSLLKGDKADLVVQKATELGISRIVPMMTRYVSVKPESAKTERYRRICTEAAKQCGRAVVPEIEEVANISEIGDRLADFDLIVFPYENEAERDLKQTLAQIGAVKSAAIIIGSEGGFSEEEVEALIKRNVTPVTLGPRILRAETACVAVTAVVMYELGEWRRR